MKRRQKIIRLNNEQRSQFMEIYARGVNEASLHISQILLAGHSLFTHRYQMEITLARAVKRKGRCMKMFNQAFRGFVV